MLKRLFLCLSLLLLLNFSSATLSLGLDGSTDIGVNFNPDTPINYSTINVNYSQYADCWTTTEGVMCDVSDISTGDLTDDDTYVQVSGDSMTGNLEIDDVGDETSIILHGGDTNLNASLIFQEVTLDRWSLLLNGLDNNFYLWNDHLDSPTWEASINDNIMTFYGDILPSASLSQDIGSGALRWRDLYVQNINAEGMEVFNLNASENITLDGYINGINISNLSNEYVPYTGATSDVDLGANTFKAGNFNFNDTNQSISIGTASSDTLQYVTALGFQAGYNNNQTSGTFIGRNAAFQNTGDYVTVSGMYSAYQNTGNRVTSSGYKSAYQNTGDYVTVSGMYSAYQNTGDYVTASGMYSAYKNTGDYVTSSGYTSAYQNTGNRVTSSGYKSAFQNTGNRVTSSGYTSAYQNTGDYVTSSGYTSAYQNTGDYVTASGMYSAYQNDADRIVAIGYGSFTNFDEDTANAEIVDTVLPDDEQVTITGHGFGAISNTLSLKASTTVTLPTGLSSDPQQWKVIDANTLECISDTFDDTGSGTLTLTPQFLYHDSVAIGYEAEPTASNQLVIMNGNVNAVPLIQGDFATGAVSINGKIYLGTAKDGSFTYNGTDLLINPKEVGSGRVIIEGDLVVEEDLNVVGNFTGNQIYGGMFYHNHTATILTFTTQDVWYPLFFTNGTHLNGFSYVGGFGVSSNLTAQVGGLYSVSYMAIGSGENNEIYLTNILVNGVEENQCGSHKKMSAGGDVITMTGTCFVELSVGDDIALATMNMGNTGDGEYYGGNLNLIRVGDI